MLQAYLAFLPIAHSALRLVTLENACLEIIRHILDDPRSEPLLQFVNVTAWLFS